MTSSRFSTYGCIAILCAVACTPACFAQQAGKKDQGDKKPAPLTTKVTTPTDPDDGRKFTQLEIDLQGGANHMSRLQSHAAFESTIAPTCVFLTNLSPLDVCTRTTGTPTPTVETPVAESFVTTIAGLGGLGIQLTKTALSNDASANAITESMDFEFEQMSPETAVKHPEKPAPCGKAKDDPEAKRFVQIAQGFTKLANCLTGPEKAGCDEVEREMHIDIRKIKPT